MSTPEEAWGSRETLSAAQFKAAQEVLGKYGIVATEVEQEGDQVDVLWRKPSGPSWDDMPSAEELAAEIKSRIQQPQAEPAPVTGPTETYTPPTVPPVEAPLEKPKFRNRGEELAANGLNASPRRQTEPVTPVEEEQTVDFDDLAAKIAAGANQRRYHQVVDEDENVPVRTEASDEVDVSTLLNPGSRPPSSKLKKPEERHGERDSLLDATETITKITTMLTSGVGGLAAGPSVGRVISAAHSAAVIDGIRRNADYVNTFRDARTALVMAQGASDLVAELVHHGFIPTTATPKEALNIATQFLADYWDLQKMNKKKHGELLILEREVLDRQIDAYTALSRASGALVVAPLTGAFGEAAMIPGVVLENVGVGIAHGIKMTLMELSTLPADVTAAFFFAPLFAFFRSMDLIQARYLSPENAIGALVLMATFGVEGAVIYDKKITDPFAIVGLVMLAFGAGVTASVVTGMVRGAASGKFTNEYDARRRQNDGPVPVRATGDEDPTIINGRTGQVEHEGKDEKKK